MRLQQLLQAKAATTLAAGVMLIAVGLIIGVIALQIVNDTVTNANFTSGTILHTVGSNIPVLFAVGLLAVAGIGTLAYFLGRT